MPWRFKNVPLMYSKEKCQRNRYSREEVPEDFDTVVQRCNYGSSPVDGKHPYGCPPNQTFILFQKEPVEVKRISMHQPVSPQTKKFFVIIFACPFYIKSWYQYVTRNLKICNIFLK